mmetsp:Transcript_4323/g.10388  ORF Transcript_4323/g.10388 Transcript_4323/m.10388 type:complete len:449 (-) Transcript_4323:874-2220(-)
MVRQIARRHARRPRVSRDLARLPLGGHDRAVVRRAAARDGQLHARVVVVGVDVGDGRERDRGDGGHAPGNSRHRNPPAHVGLVGLVEDLVAARGLRDRRGSPQGPHVPVHPERPDVVLVSKVVSDAVHLGRRETLVVDEHLCHVHRRKPGGVSALPHPEPFHNEGSRARDVHGRGDGARGGALAAVVDPVHEHLRVGVRHLDGDDLEALVRILEGTRRAPLLDARVGGAKVAGGRIAASRRRAFHAAPRIHTRHPTVVRRHGGELSVVARAARRRRRRHHFALRRGSPRRPSAERRPRLEHRQVVLGCSGAEVDLGPRGVVAEGRGAKGEGAVGTVGAGRCHTGGQDIRPPDLDEGLGGGDVGVRPLADGGPCPALDLDGRDRAGDGRGERARDHVLRDRARVLHRHDRRLRVRRAGGADLECEPVVDPGRRVAGARRQERHWLREDA